jgi:cell division protein ZipA
VLFLAALAWWESRRPRQASGDARLRSGHREPTLNEAGLAGIDTARTPQEPLPVVTLYPAATPADGAETAAVEAGMDPGPGESASEPAAGVGRGGPQADGAVDGIVDDIPTLAALPEAGLMAPPPPVVEWPSDGRILSVRLVPPVDQRFSGRTLRQALTALGFIHGRFGIFHQPDRRGRAVLSAASLVRPGMLEPETMDYQRYPGLSVFAVLPGPLGEVETLEHLLAVTHDLLERTGGRLQDDRGGPLDALGIVRWRMELAGARAAGEPAANQVLSGQPAEPAA